MNITSFKPKLSHYDDLDLAFSVKPDQKAVAVKIACSNGDAYGVANSIKIAVENAGGQAVVKTAEFESVSGGVTMSVYHMLIFADKWQKRTLGVTRTFTVDQAAELIQGVLND